MADKERILRALGEVRDPETHAPVTQLNLIEGVTVHDDGSVEVDFRPTSPYTPPMVVARVALDLAAAAASVKGVAAVRVRVTGHPLDRYLNAALERVLTTGTS